jgi:hypothetical protein
MLSMGNILSSRKAQFFILSAFAMVSLAFFISRWMEPHTIIDVSELVMHEEPFLLNNLVEKAIQTVRESRSYEELRYNLEEYKQFVTRYVAGKGYHFNFTYEIMPSPGPPGQPPIATAMICMRLSSPTMSLSATRVIGWP